MVARSFRKDIKTPIVNHGWIEVPDRPGLGVTLNEDVVRQHLMPGTGLLRTHYRVGQRAILGPAVELITAMACMKFYRLKFQRVGLLPTLAGNAKATYAPGMGACSAGWPATSCV